MHVWYMFKYETTIKTKTFNANNLVAGSHFTEAAQSMKVY